MENPVYTSPKESPGAEKCGKTMFIFFMDRHGMILQHRFPDGQTVTAAYFSKVT
jgi:hypothetical protein